MKVTLKIYLIFCFALYSISIYGQPKIEKIVQHHFSILDKLEKDIELTDGQVVAIKENLRSTKHKIDELKKKITKEDSQHLTEQKIRKIINSSDSWILEILTNKQIFQFQQKGKSRSLNIRFREMRTELESDIAANDKIKIENLRNSFAKAEIEKEKLLSDYKKSQKKLHLLQLIILSKKYSKEWKTLKKLVRDYNSDIKDIFEKNKCKSLPKHPPKKNESKGCIGKMWGDFCCRDVKVTNYFKDIPNDKCLFYPACIYKSKPHFLLLDPNT